MEEVIDLAKIKVSDVNKKHLKIICYLTISAALAYVLSVVIDKPEAVYFAPIINYIIYAVEKELKNEGYIRAIKQ